MMKKILKVFHIMYLILICGIIIGTAFLNIKYPGTQFDEILFHIKAGVGNADTTVITNALKICMPIILIAIILLYALFYDILFGTMKIKIKKVQIYPIKFLNNHRKIFTVLLTLIAIISIIFGLKIYDYVKNNYSNSGFIAKHYVDPHKTYVKFKEKRNLIYIVSESLETTFFTKKQNGNWDYEIMPELYELLNDKDSITFYNKNKYQGIKMITGATFTTASVVANSTGVPFKVPIENNSYHSENFMNGTYALGDLLKDNGYYNEVISAATTSFGGIKEFFTKHGNYEIVDKNSLEKYNLSLKDEDKGGWGLNDNYLFEAAKKRLKVISKKKKPFNMELITIDAHFPEGYIGNYSIKKYKTNYENVYATESKLIGNFINWVKKQNFYKNTTIVIVGDHLNMLDDYFNKRGIEDRYVYNCIINPAIKTKNNKRRTITALDFYPTTVAALGGKIDGNKLALGVNLFSDKKTLAEKYGFNKLKEELEKKSKFYDSYILDDVNINKIKRAQDKARIEKIKNKYKDTKKRLSSILHP